VGLERKIDAQLLAEALLHAPVAWSLFDLDGHGIAGSREYASVFELSPDDLVGLPFEAMIDPGDRGYTSTVLDQLARAETEEYVSIQPSQRPGGGQQLVRLVLRPLFRDGEPVALFSTAVPIAEEARFDAHRIQKLIENIDDTISLIDESGRLLETSGRYKPILGYPSEFWTERTIFDLLHADDALRVLAMREEVIAKPGAVVTGEFRVQAADGTYQPLEVHAVNLLHDPDVSGIVVTSRNISSMKALMKDLEHNRDAAVAEAELRSRLIATVSHELRNPLHAMCGLAELLTTSPGLTADTSALAFTLRRQIEGLTTVIDDLLDSSRLGAGAVSLASQPVLLRPLIDDVVALAGPGARDKNLDVLGEVPDDVPVCTLGDSARLRQVLSNLVGNAVKFTSSGHVALKVSYADERLTFTVIDTGTGIEPSELERVFEPFTTGTNAGDNSGAGLGLTIVRQLVELMGGTIHAASEVGVGSRFTVVVPAEVCEPPSSMADAPAPLAAGGKTVLVVDDNAVNQMLAESQLARLGMQAVVVGTGEDAVELMAKGEGPDLVLMDYHLPGIDGLEATRRIRALGARERRPRRHHRRHGRGHRRRPARVRGRGHGRLPAQTRQPGGTRRGAAPLGAARARPRGTARHGGHRGARQPGRRSRRRHRRGRPGAHVPGRAARSSHRAGRCLHRRRHRRGQARRPHVEEQRPVAGRARPGQRVPAHRVAHLGRRRAAHQQRHPSPRHGCRPLVPDLARPPTRLTRCGLANAPRNGCCDVARSKLAGLAPRRPCERAT
jgi:PAS domain S-box-containing protein